VTPRLSAAIEASVAAVPPWLRDEARAHLTELVQAILEAAAHSRPEGTES
jgi:hypothetical protein